MMKSWNSHSSDDRQPVSIYSSNDLFVGVLLPDVTGYYVHIVLLMLGQFLIGSILAVLIFYGIVKQKSRTFGLCFGCLVVIPLVLASPFPIIEYYEITNRTIRMLLCSAPMIMTLRCLEAAFSFVPKAETRSLRKFIESSSFILLPVVDSKTGEYQVTTVSHFLKVLKVWGRHLLLFSIIMSILGPMKYEPFEYSRPPTEIFVAFHWKDLMNAAVAAWLISQTLSFSFRGVAIVVMLVAGFVPDEPVDNPMLGARSPSDFWGKRWNRVIHTGLKQGVYKPVRFYSNSVGLATLAAFVASGIIHEYVWQVLFYLSSHDNPEDATKLQFGKMMLFFSWNGILIVLENLIGRQRFERWTRNIPPPLVVAMTILTALPVAHLFTGDMMRAGYCDHMRKCVFILIVERKVSLS